MNCQNTNKSSNSRNRNFFLDLSNIFGKTAFREVQRNIAARLAGFTANTAAFNNSRRAVSGLAFSQRATGGDTGDHESEKSKDKEGFEAHCEDEIFGF